ncbi:MAG: hypothetical protein FVQ79_05980 [Planctomycetes bacterium]|nr:hypothetical protein [Planctomycetota bacterium]
MKKHSRMVKVLLSLIVSMTVGAFVLMMLDSQALSEGAFSLAGLYNLSPVAEKIDPNPKSANHRNWERIEVYFSKTTIYDLNRLTDANNAKMHFVIANADYGTDGIIKSTEKWRKQQTCTSNTRRGTNIIRICIIGDNNNATPTDCQILRTIELVDALSKKYNINRKKINYPANWQI